MLELTKDQIDLLEEGNVIYDVYRDYEEYGSIYFFSPVLVRMDETRFKVLGDLSSIKSKMAREELKSILEGMLKQLTQS